MTRKLAPNLDRANPANSGCAARRSCRAISTSPRQLRRPSTARDGYARATSAARTTEGYITIVDRLKELIKYKGYQVAPAELEAVLLAHPSVADAAVIPSPDEAAGEVPKAFVVLTEDATAEGIMAFVAERVAPYKKIRRIEIHRPDPEIPSGKILRRVLVERERASDPVSV